MLAKLTFLHLRWFALFVSVGLFTQLISHLQENSVKVFADPAFYASLGPMMTVCAILAILVPWGMYMVDPRRPAGPVTLMSFLTYWKAI